MLLISRSSRDTREIMWMCCDALAALLKDLQRHERIGFETSTCEDISMQIGEMAIVANSIPAVPLFGDTLWESFVRFQDRFNDWANVSNDKPDAFAKRRAIFRDLMGCRHAIVRRTAAVAKEKKNLITNYERLLAPLDHLFSRFPETLRELGVVLDRLRRLGFLSDRGANSSDKNRQGGRDKTDDEANASNDPD